MIVLVNLYNWPKALKMDREEMQKRAHKHRENLTGENIRLEIPGRSCFSACLR
jgi:hypothetical protein